MSEVTEPKTVSTEQWIGFFSMVLGIFMAILDIQIVASSLEQIQAGLSATQDEITWVQTAYLVAEVVIIPLSGWLARLLSTRPLFVIAAYWHGTYRQWLSLGPYKAYSAVR